MVHWHVVVTMMQPDAGTQIQTFSKAALEAARNFDPRILTLEFFAKPHSVESLMYFGYLARQSGFFVQPDFTLGFTLDADHRTREQLAKSSNWTVQFCILFDHFSI